MMSSFSKTLHNSAIAVTVIPGISKLFQVVSFQLIIYQHPEFHRLLTAHDARDPFVGKMYLLYFFWWYDAPLHSTSKI